MPTTAPVTIAFRSIRLFTIDLPSVERRSRQHGVDVRVLGGGAVSSSNSPPLNQSTVAEADPAAQAHDPGQVAGKVGEVPWSSLRLLQRPREHADGQHISPAVAPGPCGAPL